jgi:branched-chain amino acid transport system permease protein
MRITAPGWVGIAGLALAAVPFFKPPAFYESFLYLVFYWIVLATSWNILSGYSGYFSFGHGAFFGAGMYTTAMLAGTFGVPFLWTLPAAALVASLFGVGIGAVVFRVGSVRGELFALLTLAVTFVLATVVLNTRIDGGQGVNLGGVALPAIMPSPSSTFYVLALAMALATLWIAYGVYRSRLGTGLFAIHDDEDVAEVMGVPTFRYKLQAFGLSCGLAGMAGGIHAMFISYITVGETFSIIVPLTVVLMSVLGGTRHWLGPAVGATVITGLLYAFTAGNYAVAGRAAVGLILIVVILFLPQGLLGRFVPRLQGRRRSGSVPVAGAAVAPAARPPGRAGSGTLLEIRGLSKAFKGLQALDSVDLEVRRGEILGLVGPNGSGKSTTINLVSGHYRSDSGRIVFEGRDIAGLKAHRIAQAGIARTYQIPRPFAHMSVLHNVALPAMFGHAALDRAAAEREARYWLEFTGLAAKADALPEDLNLHQRKFLELARALASRSSLLLLDEVLSGLTPSEIDSSIRTIRAIRDQGATIVFVEHVMRAVMELTDRIVVLNHGRVIAEGSPRDVMGRTEVVTAYLGKPQVGKPHA